MSKTISLDALAHCVVYTRLEVKEARRMWAKARDGQSVPQHLRKALRYAYVTRYVAARRTLTELKG